MSEVKEYTHDIKAVAGKAMVFAGDVRTGEYQHKVVTGDSVNDILDTIQGIFDEIGAKGYEGWGIYDKNDDLEACEAHFKAMLDVAMEFHKNDAK